MLTSYIRRVFENPQVVAIEKAIVEEYHRNLLPGETLQQLLRERWLLLREFNRYDSETAKLLIGLNQALTKALSTLYEKTLILYHEYMTRDDYCGEFEITAKCKLGYQYPKGHPVQSERAETIWEILTQGYVPLYDDDGCSRRIMMRKNLSPPSLVELLYLSEELNNWNIESLDREWSQDMNLIHPFHNLYTHMPFSLFDLIYVRDFNLETNLTLDSDLTCETSCSSEPIG